MVRTLAPVAAAAALLVALAAPARADDKSECLKAFDDAQQLRMDGKLRAARERLQVCASDRCPAMLRQDCTQWTGEVMAAMPTVVFGARDAQGQDVSAVRVLVDGALVVDHIDGKPVAVDPGAHTFRFEPSTAGQAAVERQAIVRAGEKNRAITITLGLPGVSAVPAQPAQEAPQPAPDSVPIAPGPSPLAWVFAGVGVAALGGSLALELSVKSDADSLRASCGAAGCSSSQVDPLRTRQTLAGVALGVGLVSLGAAAYFFFFFHPRAQPDAGPPSAAASMRVEITPGPGVVGGGLVGRF